ncbi:hypothetical protein A3C37_05475 [Candidatus Peribacteria bacterium RIFCSPHIGHO2_02_FULL_53_20]|nr:MAG: hypothetical protein A3C37_05475 [Candidatus Peribacteria bacterium RIFCSPHIGHO2_02_FULL_53_20]OGJ67625.1 MAG: hypothetical protein A3B61_02085 [Candidatus Peribacteria bacterium RIFCSPLOWO2_01_FULL_53_10]
MDRVKIARETLMTAMITVFGLFGIDKFIHPAAWLGWVAPWIENLSGISRGTWLRVAGGYELLLAAALVFPHRLVRRIAAWGMVIHLIFVLTQTGFNDLFVRDLGLLLSAIALGILL